MGQTEFPPDTVEEQIPDLDTAERMLADKDPSFLRYVQLRRQQFERTFGEDYEAFLDHAQTALLIAYARFAVRHGTWGDDVHQYHNEGHAVEILADRINYLCERAGYDRLQPTDWVLLTLFAAMHDLRQRQPPDMEALIGTNERASIDECHRILTESGFDPVADKPYYDDLEMMIAGSTFNVQAKTNPNISPPEAASSCGAVAPMLVLELEQSTPDWKEDPDLRRRVRLTLIASDLDTANVSEPVIKFARSAVRLCKEIEFRNKRDVNSEESAKPVLFFLTVGQEAYFFDLHEFDSELGKEILGAMKEKNSPLIRQLCDHIRDTFGEVPEPGVTGQMIIDEFMHKASEISGRAARR
jgi:hypothetical protein